MPEWTFPVKLPQFTDAEFEQQKAEYVAQHGYTVSPPGLGDIIKIRWYDEPDPAEYARWKKRQRAQYLLSMYPNSPAVPGWRSDIQGFPNHRRYQDIHDLLNKKRERRDRMLASPMPTWGMNIASVMTFFDDINDTLGSLAVLGRLAAYLLPRALGRLLLGPVGWLLLLADIAGLVLDLMRLPFRCVGRKRSFERVADVNPFSKNAKLRRASKLRRILPSKGELIEMAQTADNVFGVGLCLGPIIGFGYDVASGIVRTAMGQQVTWGRPPPRRPKHVRTLEQCIRSAEMLHMAGDEMSEEDHLAMMFALNGATQVLKPYVDQWNPIDEVEGLQFALLDAPTPVYQTTLDILAEKGIAPGEKIGWPGLDQPHASIENLWDKCQPTAAKRFWDFAKRNRNSYTGACGCQNGFEFGLNMMHMLEGGNTVDVEYEPAWKGWHGFFSTGCTILRGTSIVRGGCRNGERHYVQFGTIKLHIGGCSKSFRELGLAYRRKELTLHTPSCDLTIPPSLCPPGNQEWVFYIGYTPE